MFKRRLGRNLSESDVCMQIVRAVETAPACEKPSLAGTDVTPHDAEQSKVRGFESEFSFTVEMDRDGFYGSLYSGT